MTEIGQAALGIYPSFDGFARDLDRGTSKAMLTAGTTGGTKFGDAAGRSAGSRFGSVFKTAAKASLIGLAGLAALGVKFGADALEEAREAQKVGALTAAVIKSTGGAAKVTEKQVGDLSTRLSELAGVDDELVQEGANVLLTFTKIRNEVGAGNDIFNQATTAALNMSAALKSDLSSASIQVGKALNDPIKGVAALGRAGVQFSEDQVAMIESLVESGDVLGAQKVILGELETQFKGAARSQASESDKLTVAYGNLKEEIGNELLPVMDDLAIFLRKKGIPAVRDFAGWVRDDAAPAVKGLAEDLEPVVGFVKDLGKFLLDLPGPAKLGLLAGAIGGIGALKLRGGGGLTGGIGSAIGLAKPVPVFVTNPGFDGGTGGPSGSPASGKGALVGQAAVTASVATALGVLGTLGIYEVSKKFAPEQTERGNFGTPQGGPGSVLASDKEGQILNLGGVEFASSFGGFISKAEDAAGAIAAALNTLPKQLQTDFKVNGVPESKKAAQSLVRQYELTPKEKRTVMALAGVEQNSKTTRDYIGVLSTVPKEKGTNIKLTGVSEAHAQINGLMGALNSLATAGSAIGDQIRANAAADRRFNRRLNDRD